MRELLAMWRRPRMILLTGVVTIVYPVLLFPFKDLALIPGFTSVRPAGALPVVFSLLFGPAAAWGSAFGNLIGDVFGGTMNPVSPYGFVGNFLFGLVGYKLWGTLDRLSTGNRPTMESGDQFPEYVVVAVVSSAVVANVIAWGAEITGQLPFSVFGTLIFVNNLIAAVVMGTPLLFFLYPRVERAGLLYTQLMPAYSRRRRPRSAVVDANDFVGMLRWWSTWYLVVVVIAWSALGILISVVFQDVPFGVSPDAVAGMGGAWVQIVLGASGISAVVITLALAPNSLPEGQPDGKV